MKLFSALLAGVLLTTAVPASAQSLGEVAKKEQERRKATPPAAKTFTNDDLKKIALPPEPADASAKPTEKADASMSSDADKDKKPAAKPDKDAKDETFWHGRIIAAREELRRDEAFRDALQSRINALSADFANRDDPFQRAQIADDRQKALAELTRVSTEITNTNKLIADIQEEARQAGVPPGWLR